MARETTGVINKIVQKHDTIRSDYNERQMSAVQDLTMGNVKIRILSFLLDSIFMFWPSFLFIISLLLLTSPANIGGGIISSTWELMVIYIVSILCFNTGSAVYWMGQTFGMRYYQLKIVKRDNSEASVPVIVLRELCGVSIPWVLILLSFKLFNFAVFIMLFFAFLLINLLFMIADGQHRSIIDLFLNTKIVLLPQEMETNDEEMETADKEEKMDEIRVKTVGEEIKEKIDNEIKKTKEDVLEGDAAVKEEKPAAKNVQKTDAKENAKKDTPVSKEKQPAVEKPKPKAKKEKKEKPADAEKKTKPEKKKEEKEKSVTEIISEAVSVVDQALEPKREIHPIRIERNKKTDDSEQAAEPIESKPQENAVKEKKPGKTSKNQKKKNRQKSASGSKKKIKAKNIKPAAKSHKPLKKN